MTTSLFLFPFCIHLENKCICLLAYTGVRFSYAYTKLNMYALYVDYRMNVCCIDQLQLTIVSVYFFLLAVLFRMLFLDYRCSHWSTFLKRKSWLLSPITGYWTIRLSVCHRKDANTIPNICMLTIYLQFITHHISVSYFSNLVSWYCQCNIYHR